MSSVLHGKRELFKACLLAIPYGVLKKNLANKGTFSTKFVQRKLKDNKLLELGFVLGCL